MKQLVLHLKPIEKLPVVSFYHKLVDHTSNLSAIGFYTAQLTEMRGYKHSTPISNNCFLDNFYPIKTEKNPKSYLMYFPAGDLSSQVDAYFNALLFAKALNRTLLVPPLVFVEEHTTCSLDILIDTSHSIDQISWEEYSNKNIVKPQIQRIVSFESLESLGDSRNFEEILLDTYGWRSMGLKLSLLVYSGEHASIIQNYSDCGDQILVFQQLHTVFDSYNYKPHDRMPIESPIAHSKFFEEILKRTVFCLWRKYV
jgi:hypothetical protein